MKKLDLLQGLALAGVASLTATGIITAPAQASTLVWSDGTSDFFSDVNPDAEEDTFSVIFSPDVSLNPPNDGIGDTTVSTADGVFTPPFTASPPNNSERVLEAVGNFEYVGPGSTTDSFLYALDGDLDFEFIDFPSETGSGNVVLTLLNGTLFEGIFDTDNSVEFELAAGQGERIIASGIDFEDETFLDDGFEFEDGSLPAGGGYTGILESTPPKTPEPASMLGIIAVGGLGLATRRKQCKQEQK